MNRTVILVIALAAAIVAIAAPMATTDYVQSAASNVLVQAQNYTRQYAPKIDLSGYVTKTDSNLRIDSATNVVWRCVWSNGVEYIYAYSNTVNKVTQ